MYSYGIYYKWLITIKCIIPLLITIASWCSLQFISQVHVIISNSYFYISYNSSLQVFFFSKNCHIQSINTLNTFLITYKVYPQGDVSLKTSFQTIKGCKEPLSIYYFERLIFDLNSFHSM